MFNCLCYLFTTPVKVSGLIDNYGTYCQGRIQVLRKGLASEASGPEEIGRGGAPRLGYFNESINSWPIYLVDSFSELRLGPKKGVDMNFSPGQAPTYFLV